MSAIEVNHITKEYLLGEHASLKDSLKGMLARLNGKHALKRKVFTALDDIDFKVEQGEIIGIIGSNGAGKSTLLKILSNVVQPTSGSIHVKGKIAPLIEVGAGLVGELTGRENIFLNSAVLGIPRFEIKKKLDEIISFAELEEFIDTPIKRYSTGMKVRLGFSIATSINADVLIVDEVLAVGDLAFQRKCFDRMEKFMKSQGKTVLLVSHNIRQVERLCSRAILLEKGGVLVDGDTATVCDRFYQRNNAKIMNSAKAMQKKQITTVQNEEISILSIELLDSEGNVCEHVTSDAPLRIRVKFQLHHDYQGLEIVVGTHRTDFVYLTSGSTHSIGKSINYKKGVHEIVQITNKFPMIPGVYCVRIAVFDGAGRSLFYGETLKTFQVEGDIHYRHEGMRTLNIPVSWIVDGKPYSDGGLNRV